ncbi:MAG: RNA polymerase sigma factor [Planctomycetes bacterium]|nr:RNA polymerase sigma factor [Planctomycetota bacterium]
MGTQKFVRFQTTLWPLVESAKAGRREALETLVQSYHPILRTFARARGLEPADADDAAQEVCLQLCRPEFLSSIDRNRGRFRSLLLAIAKHVIAAIRQGPWRPKVALEEVRGDEQDEAFDRLWAEELLRAARERLRQDKRPEPSAAFEMRYVEGLPFKEIARRMGCTVPDVSNYVQQGKTRLRSYLRESISRYAASEDEYKDDWALLVRRLEESGRVTPGIGTL